MPNGADVPSCLVPSSKGDRPNDAVAPRAGLTACFRQRPGAATHMAKLDHKRVDLFYEKLTGEKTGSSRRLENRAAQHRAEAALFEAAAEADAIIESS
jgi:hypothetical protein